ncbi:exodeoxyribonuclease VII small subunit [Algoriphagus sp.]|uniref:exodeoxyribonuclease VII small subunit n=1 Tax=Algoriphagus sp. TaxID=1872435 RepID=UPI002610761F|nr:exodeoxyribonuclease VII small subunit [Algoriphagus sp.]
MKELNYTDAMQRLELIVTQLEEGKKSVDELSQLVNEASELVNICREKLKNTEASIQKVFETS